MNYYIVLTVNTDSNEYDYTIPYEDSLDAAMKRVLDMHPSCTSVVMTIVPTKTSVEA
jgi:hypothetical protein